MYIHIFIYLGFLCRMCFTYSETSDKGLSVLRTLYKKSLYKGQDFFPQTVLSIQFNHRTEETSLLRTIKDKNWLVPRCPLFRGSTVRVYISIYSCFCKYVVRNTISRDDTPGPFSAFQCCMLKRLATLNAGNRPGDKAGETSK